MILSHRAKSLLMRSFMRDFGDWLKESREANGLDMRSLARISGVDASSISRIENKRTQATLSTVARLCRAFKKSLQNLLMELEVSFVGPDAALQPSVEAKRIPIVTPEEILAFL